MLTPKIEQRISQYLRFLKPLRYRVLKPLDFEVFETEETMRTPPENKAWEKINTPYHYGKAWHCSWFRSVFQSPAESTLPLFLRVVPNTDSLVFIDGKPSGAFNPFHKKIKVPADGKEHSLYIESYAGHPFPGCHPLEQEAIIFTIGKQVPAYPNTFEGGALVLRVEPIYSLYYDLRCLFELAQTVDPQSLRRAKILKGLYDALGGIHFESTAETLEVQAAAAAAKIAPLLAAINGSTTPDVYLIGHAHIDHAWLWHIAETERKVARTYINMVRLSEEYPDFVFIQTQPAQLEIIKNEYPHIFSAVKNAYKNGNWEPNGGMWVEADCNIPSGESLIRQFLVGKAATQDMLGYEADTLWLPDVFGYAAALPQILSGCRIQYFVTSKINWNDTTRFPYDTFLWRGIDGTVIKTHYISSRTQGYNGSVSPGSLAEIWREIQHKELQSGAVKSIGEGDGGGGTTRGDLEMARRLHNAEGVPRSRWEKVSDALDHIFSSSDDWPEWHGELYLELHRGTYTTQAKTKRYNRKLEFALRRVELLCVLAAFEGYHDSLVDLLPLWKVLLTHQFHDIIPGSSIHRVYVEAEEAYAKLEQTLTELTGALLKKLSGNSDITLFNDLSWERNDPVLLPASAVGEALALKSARGDSFPVQRYRDLDDNDVALCFPQLPPLTCVHFTASFLAAVSSSPFVYKDDELLTPFYRLRFDDAGRIISLVVLEQNRELVAAAGCFNRFISAQDMPVLWEAWDIDADWTRFITEETRLVYTEVITEGTLCFRLRRTYTIGVVSELIQDSVFYAQERRIDFETKVSWHERRKLLKVGFDTAFDATQVRCEVQYGHIMRNATRNLPQDRAKFEICAHKWICLEDSGGGLALLNDCKYGHDVCGGSMRLTLLRAPTAPDPSADRGEHRFTYSLVPFSGPFSESGVVHSAYELNIPAAFMGSSEPISSAAAAHSPLFTVKGQAVIAESIKLPQTDQTGSSTTVVIRVYESLGGRAETLLHFYREIDTVYETDMLEDNKLPLYFSGRDIVLEFRAFEIKTIMVSFRSGSHRGKVF